MRSFKQFFVSLFIAAVILNSTASLSFARFDEGMYAPNQIFGLDLKKKGLKIKPEEVYNPNGGGLTDAVIRLSIGCSAEFVSPEGLILTNHHCAFDALVQASSPENDLVEHGFKADNRGGEIVAKGYSIFITERVEDVSAKVLANTASLSGDALAAAIKKNTEELQSAEQDKAPKGSTVRIQTLNNGYYYYLYQTKQIKDVRVVYAPPRNIGVFGGDPDNFEWTRHTGDFTFLRAYTAPDGSSADYSTNNVPYKAKKFLSVNIGGLKENDFVFVLGYPGGTTRYRESQSIEFARDANFPFLADWLDARSASLKSIGESDEEKRIAFQSDIASFDNANKVYGGGAQRLRLSQVVEKRRAEEAKFATWVAANPARQQKYGTVLSEIAAVSAESNRYAKRDVVVRRMPDASTPVLLSIFRAVTEGKMLNADEKAKKLADLTKALDGREKDYESDMIKYFLKAFDNLPADQKFEGAEKLFGSAEGKARRSAEAEFAKTIADGYWTPETIAALYGPQTMEFRPERDNVVGFVRALIDERNAANQRAAVFASKIDRLRLLYQQGMAEMKGITPYPDANSTLRFSYGYIKGYSPRESEYRSPFTTLKGMYEKDSGVNPFDMPQKIKDLDAAKDFGRYGTGDSVVVNFISSTDIIGGNSGSPILNANGEQVGICFDGNMEGLGNDFFYDPNLNRTISVDMRFVLFVTDKVGGAGWILNEMKIVGK